MFHIQGSHPEHLSGSFRIRSRNDGSVHVIKPPVVKIFMDGIGHGMPDTENSSESIRAGPQVGILPEKFEGMSFF